MKSTCPSRDELEALLGDRLDSHAEDSLNRHVEECAACQGVLGELTGAADGPHSHASSGPTAPAEVLAFLDVVKQDTPQFLRADTWEPTGKGRTEDTVRDDRPSDRPSDRLPSVPGFEVQRLLGRGGMGVVYLARHTALKRLVALKMLHAGDHDAETLYRFRTEAESVARLGHPNIVQIFEINEADGRPYFALEYLEGGTLAWRMGGRPQPPHEAARLIAVLARAVHAAHQAGIVHRDLKPHNILFAADGTPKIADFGLAKSLFEDSGQTKSGAVLGTPAYMAPEQAGGHSKGVGPASDVYALGSILYQMLTGQPPFKSDKLFDMLWKVQWEKPMPLRNRSAQVPRDLEAICLKCLEKNLARRYESAAELADDIDRWLAWKPTSARPLGPAERFALWTRRRPALAVVLLGGTAVLLFALASWWYFSRRTETEKDPGEKKTRLEQTTREKEEADARRPRERRQRPEEQLALVATTGTGVGPDEGRGAAAADSEAHPRRGGTMNTMAGTNAPITFRAPARET
jgi:serine/threonine protein kinase